MRGCELNPAGNYNQCALALPAKLGLRYGLQPRPAKTNLRSRRSAECIACP